MRFCVLPDEMITGAMYFRKSRSVTYEQMIFFVKNLEDNFKRYNNGKIIFIDYPSFREICLYQKTQKYFVYKNGKFNLKEECGESYIIAKILQLKNALLPYHIDF